MLTVTLIASGERCAAKASWMRVESLITHRFPLDRIQEAFAAHRSPEAIKVTVSI